MDINEMRQKRARLIAEARAEFERRSSDWNSEDQANFDKRMAEADTLLGQIQAAVKLAEAEKQLEQRTSEPERPTTGAKRPTGEFRDAAGAPITKERSEALEAAFRAYILDGRDAAEVRSLEAGLDTKGGFTVPTQELSNRLLKNVDDAVFIRRHATVVRMIQAESLGILSMTDPDDFDWTTELQTGSLDTSMSFGRRDLKPHPLAKRIKISDKLLRSSSMDIIALVGERFGYKVGVTEEKAFLTGNGVQRPLGVFVASTDGISTARDVSDGMSTTAVSVDGLKNVKWKLKPQYWSGARWLMHREQVREISKLKDGEGRYLFETDSTGLEAGRLLGLPVDMSEFAPNINTTGLYVGILANWARGYTIVDALNMKMQRLDELYAETNQVGFIWRRETDAAPVLEEAFVRIKLA